MSLNIEELWNQFGEVIIDQNECIESNFHIWAIGTDRHDIWQWFDQNSEYGLVSLMFGKGN
ncbi:hypothetical protein [Acinetobacter gandensis]|uniref:hypothetical protein n=1 Tax=Acinetobacter gandensis TaxID=1443941 RepID=UPI003989FD97